MTDSTRAAGRLSLVGGELCLDFTNTVSGRLEDRPNHEHLFDYSDLIAWAEHAQAISPATAHTLHGAAQAHPRQAARALERALRLRECIYNIVSAVANRRSAEAQDVALLNPFITEAYAHLALQTHEDHFEWMWTGQSELEAPLYPIVVSVAELLTSDRLARVRQCAGDDCAWLFVDTSKNHSRRWCDMNDCGNRAKARRHYAKVSATV